MSSTDNIKDVDGRNLHPINNIQKLSMTENSVSLSQFLAEQNLPPVFFSAHQTSKNLDQQAKRDLEA